MTVHSLRTTDLYASTSYYGSPSSDLCRFDRLKVRFQSNPFCWFYFWYYPSQTENRLYIYNNKISWYKIVTKLNIVLVNRLKDIIYMVYKPPRPPNKYQSKNELVRLGILWMKIIYYYHFGSINTKNDLFRFLKLMYDKDYRNMDWLCFFFFVSHKMK